MKIILEPSNKDYSHDGVELCKVEIEYFRDAITLPEMWDNLIRPALLAQGYSEKTVDGFLKENE